MTIDIRSEPCTCPSGSCAEFVEPDTKCINRLPGEVRTQVCQKYESTTWHQNGECLRCREIGATP